MAALKYSRQRESIKEFLRSRTDHPTADTVYENLRQIYPNISLGTVYRNLSLLSDIGEIRKLTNFGSADRYDGRVAPHSHFMCTRCNRVIDMHSDSLNGILEQAAAEFIHGKVFDVGARSIRQTNLSSRPLYISLWASRYSLYVFSIGVL